MLLLRWAHRLCFIHALPAWNNKPVLLIGFPSADGVKFDIFMLRCLLYCAQVLWENWCCYNEPCSYGNHNGSVIEDCGLFGPGGAKVESIPLPRASVCLCQFREWRRGERKQNPRSLHGGFDDRRVTLAPPTRHRCVIIPPNGALWWRHLEHFIKLLECVAPSGESHITGRDGCGGGAAPRQPLVAVSVMCSQF